MRLVNFIKKLLVKRKLEANNNKYQNYKTISDKATVKNSVLKEDVRIANSASVRKSVIGDFSSIGRNTKVTHARIGKFCAISWDATINAINHPVSHLTISAFPYVPRVGSFVKKRTQDYEYVDIGNDVWVGAHSIIMPGVKIGDGAVIAAGAIVTKDVPAYAIVTGIPARILKYRFEKKVREELLNIQWWNIDKKIIKENIHLFQKQVTLETIDELKNILN